MDLQTLDNRTLWFLSMRLAKELSASIVDLDTFEEAGAVAAEIQYRASLN